MLDRTYEDYIKDLHFYERRLDDFLNWGDIAATKIRARIIGTRYYNENINDLKLIGGGIKYIECNFDLTM